MSENDLNTIRAMEKYGGSFVSHLGQAARHADDKNLQKIKDAFPEYWKQYEQMAKEDQDNARTED